MFTTVASRTTMSCARPTVARVHQRREEGAAAGETDGEVEDMDENIYETDQFRIRKVSEL